MNKYHIPIMQLINLALLRGTVYLAEFALKNRDWLQRAKTYGPLMIATVAAYLLGRVVGLALVSQLF